MAETEGNSDVLGTEKDSKVQNPDQATQSATQTQPALDEDVRIQTAVQETQVDIEPNKREAHSTSESVIQERIHPQEEETMKANDDVGKSTATVKVLIMPEGHMMTVAFTIGLTAQVMKNHFANELRIPSDFILLTLNGNPVENNQTLMSLGVQPHATVQLEMSSLDPENYPIRPVKLQQECNMPDVITVRVQTDAGSYQDVVVEIERATQRNAFLGGYRHKVTKTEYHNAGVQTVPRRRPDRGVEMFSRDTQTVHLKQKSQQCTNNTSTQMTKPGCYISNMKDKLIAPGKYITAEEYHSKRLKAAIVLQTYIRRWLAKRLTMQLRLAKELYMAWIAKEEKRKIDEKEERIRVEYHRRMNPKNKEDFALLYSALEKWRKEEVEHINATLSGAERKAALCALLDQETQFIISIENHRQTELQRWQKNTVKAFLNKCAAPKQWRALDGKITQMDTPHTIRARELRDLYCSLTLRGLSHEERVDVLLTLKHTVKEHDCKLTGEIMQLVDREADLMLRSVKESNLEGLRTRITTLFLQYIKTPMFNLQASKMLRVPQDPEQLRKNVHFCRGCSNFLPYSNFPMFINTRVVGLCYRCKKLENEANHRKNFSYYRNFLKYLQKDETEITSDAKIPYLLQEQDMHYLVDVVWGGKSAMSACNDLHELLTVRWDKSHEWSPWNCILLTKDEAAAHRKIENIEKTYASVFISNIKQKHTLARKYFSQIPVLAEYLQELYPQPAAHNAMLVTKPINTVSKPSQ